jgi:hypothetical protein
MQKRTRKFKPGRHEVCERGAMRVVVLTALLAVCASACGPGKEQPRASLPASASPSAAISAAPVPSTQTPVAARCGDPNPAGAMLRILRAPDGARMPVAEVGSGLPGCRLRPPNGQWRLVRLWPYAAWVASRPRVPARLPEICTSSPLVRLAVARATGSSRELCDPRESAEVLARNIHTFCNPATGQHGAALPADGVSPGEDLRVQSAGQPDALRPGLQPENDFSGYRDR